MKIDESIKELDRIFAFFNKEFYNSELQKPIILIQSNGRNTNVLGWCTTQKLWRDREKTESYYEITICAEYLNRNIEEVIATLLHEMVHLHNLQNDIKDVSRGKSYHNKRFKRVAEDKGGLIIEYDKRIGWSITTLKDSTKDLIRKLKPKIELFKVARQNALEIEIEDGEEEGEDKKKKKKSSMRKYVCPTCDIIIRATKDVNVICGECGQTFVKEDDEIEEETEEEVAEF